jgi:hypothetical protein
MMKKAVVVDTSKSAQALLKPVPLGAVRVGDGFWHNWQKVMREVMLPEQYRQLEETDRLNNFRRVVGKSPKPYQMPFFNDTDVYKWLEAAAYTLATHPNEDLDRRVDETIALVAEAQDADGYLDTYYALERASERWSNLTVTHELYCAGHLIQAAVAHHRATGKDSLLKVARRFADLICATLGPAESGRRPGTDGHPEIEMAMVELGRATADPKYIRQAAYFIDARGYGLVGGDEYHQDHKPFRQFTRMYGHAVRALYLNAGAADVYLENGDTSLRKALDAMWWNMTRRQMYLTGGQGPHFRGEAYGNDYQLPNERAYAETCAAIAAVQWAWRMLAADGDPAYADLIETTLYNGFLAGASLDGKEYFYMNPLASDGSYHRTPWFSCACCPPNVARILASLPGYWYSTSPGEVWVHQYATNQAELIVGVGNPVTFTQQTQYPWEGKVRLEVKGEGRFAVNLRIPGWATGAGCSVNGKETDQPAAAGAYLRLERAWKPGDLVELNLPLRVRRMVSHPYAAENHQRVALMRGPLVYCLEAADNPGFDLRDVALSKDAPLSVEYVPNLLGGVSLIRGHGQVLSHDPSWLDALYLEEGAAAGGKVGQVVPIQAIPYYAWANRQPGQMQVWLRGSE